MEYRNSAMHCSSFSRRLDARCFMIDSNDPSPNIADSFSFFVEKSWRLVVVVVVVVVDDVVDVGVVVDIGGGGGGGVEMFAAVGVVDD